MEFVRRKAIAPLSERCHSETCSVAFWMAMIINMVNFIDGLDGLAAGVCGISALTFCIIALSTNFPAAGVIAAILAGCTFAFLRFNFHPASIFMGDAGSMLLGFVLACLSVQSVMKGTAAIALVLPLLVLGVPFVDLFLIVWRRWRRGVPFYSPGQDHVHHDLVLVRMAVVRRVAARFHHEVAHGEVRRAVRAAHEDLHPRPAHAVHRDGRRARGIGAHHEELAGGGLGHSNPRPLPLPRSGRMRMLRNWIHAPSLWSATRPATRSTSVATFCSSPFT